MPGEMLFPPARGASDAARQRRGVCRTTSEKMLFKEKAAGRCRQNMRNLVQEFAGGA